MTTYSRRRALSLGIVGAAVLAFVGLVGLRVHALNNPYQFFKPVPVDQAQAELRGCAYRDDAANASGFIDVLVAGARVVGPSEALALDQGRVAITGWALLDHPLRPVDGVVAVVDGRCAVAADIRESRPDVATVLKNPLAAASGYTLVLDPSELPKGSHRIAVYAIDARHRKRTRVGSPMPVTIR
jgi:hypothetical protein